MKKTKNKLQTSERNDIPSNSNLKLRVLQHFLRSSLKKINIYRYSLEKIQRRADRYT